MLQTIKLIKKRRHILNKDIKYKTERVTEGSGKQVKRGLFPFTHLTFISHIFSANGVRNYSYFSFIVATVKPEHEHKHCNQLPVLPYHTGNNYLPLSVIPWSPKLLSAFLH